MERRLREYRTAPNRKSLSATKPASKIPFEHPFASNHVINDAASLPGMEHLNAKFTARK
jgi:hypothetical protein